MKRLGVNIDHIATLRNARGEKHPDPIDAAKKVISKKYGDEYLPKSSRKYKVKTKNAQEAHEAIRPAGATFIDPEKLKSSLSDAEFKLYDLIWKRTDASKMKSAKS